MNRSFHNIDREIHPGRPASPKPEWWTGTWSTKSRPYRVGYSRTGAVWHISILGKHKDGTRYYARQQTGTVVGLGAFYAHTLEEVSKELESR